MNTNRLIFECADEIVSETIQRIAFSFGFRWGGTLKGDEIQHLNYKYLIFDHSTQKKEITYITSYRNFITTGGCVTTNNISEAIKFFKNPPTNSIKVGVCEVLDTGVVRLNGATDLSTDTLDKLVEAKNKQLGKTSTTRLPQVSFAYNGYNRRIINVVAMTDTHVKGYDVDDGNKFKTFSRGLIAYDGRINLIGFSE
jgi:hypothetical protein